MMLLRSIALGATLAFAGLAPGHAQIARTDLADASPPAEFPPSSFEGRQYVDSAGCVFVRAGQSATSIWVPRVTADRKVLCGFRPTLTRTAETEAPVVEQPRRVAMAPAGAVAPRGAERAGRYVPPRVTHSLTPTPYRNEAEHTPRTARVAHLVTRAAGTPISATEAGQRATSGTLTVGTLISPPSVPPVRIPPGYRPAWDDGRLNPYAGKQMLSGALQQAQVWTQTVPRRLKAADPRDAVTQHNLRVYPVDQYGTAPARRGPGQPVTVQSTVRR